MIPMGSAARSMVEGAVTLTRSLVGELVQVRSELVTGDNFHIRPSRRGEGVSLKIEARIRPTVLRIAELLQRAKDSL